MVQYIDHGKANWGSRNSWDYFEDSGEEFSAVFLEVFKGLASIKIIKEKNVAYSLDYHKAIPIPLCTLD